VSGDPVRETLAELPWKVVVQHMAEGDVLWHVGSQQSDEVLRVREEHSDLGPGKGSAALAATVDCFLVRQVLKAAVQIRALLQVADQLDVLVEEHGA
jgi:hypothetical protein